MDSKPWYLSKTIWMNMIMGVLGAVSVAYPHANFLTNLISSNMGLMSTVWAGLGLAIRFITKDKIVLVD